MKYIRTKDRIYKISQAYSNKDRITVFYDESINGIKGFSYDLPNENIIKQADTIEELCDEFIIKVKDIESEDYGYLIIDKLGGYEKVLSLNKQAQENGAIIYGAIWTDKGLIYVAKMNDKGELELL